MGQCYQCPTCSVFYTIVCMPRYKAEFFSTFFKELQEFLAIAWPRKGLTVLPPMHHKCIGAYLLRYMGLGPPAIYSLAAQALIWNNVFSIIHQTRRASR